MFRAWYFSNILTDSMKKAAILKFPKSKSNCTHVISWRFYKFHRFWEFWNSMTYLLTLPDTIFKTNSISIHWRQHPHNISLDLIKIYHGENATDGFPKRNLCKTCSEIKSLPCNKCSSNDSQNSQKPYTIDAYVAKKNP